MRRLIMHNRLRPRLARWSQLAPREKGSAPLLAAPDTRRSPRATSATRPRRQNQCLEVRGVRLQGMHPPLQFGPRHDLWQSERSLKAVVAMPHNAGERRGHTNGQPGPATPATRAPTFDFSRHDPTKTRGTRRHTMRSHQPGRWRHAIAAVSSTPLSRRCAAAVFRPGRAPRSAAPRSRAKRTPTPSRLARHCNEDGRRRSLPLRPPDRGGLRWQFPSHRARRVRVPAQRQVRHLRRPRRLPRGT
mmetsp:Transcript_11091/g.29399  ORF Transcript_11091/g.29399 Transcript_11091/m.29399 type:complete len:245 (+) Transcript_11091:106-840(+)